MRIYTKTGDDGSTGLLGPGRVPKDHPRVEAYGTIDELNAVLGLARAQGMAPRADVLVAHLQEELFSLGSALADPRPGGHFHDFITGRHVEQLESTIDAFDRELAPIDRFILPGGTLAAAQLHLARTVCRRAERLAIALARRPGEDVPAAIIVYLNRLGDLLFVLARVVNQRAGVSDVFWEGPHNDAAAPSGT